MSRPELRRAQRCWSPARAAASASASRAAFAAAGADLHHRSPTIRRSSRRPRGARRARPPSPTSPTTRRSRRVARQRSAALDVLINNAGLERLTPLDDASAENEATFRRILEINVVGTFLVTRAALPRMRGRRAHHQYRLGLGPRRRAAVRRLCRLQARRHRPDQDLGEGARPARHHRQRGLPRLGADRGLHALARARWRSGAGRRETALLADIIGAQALPGLDGAGRHRRALSVPRLRSRRQHHRPDARHRSRRSAMVARLPESARWSPAPRAASAGRPLPRLARPARAVIGIDLVAPASCGDCRTRRRRHLPTKRRRRRASTRRRATLGGLDILVNCRRHRDR